MNKFNKEIYIIHQYLEKSHFKALYDNVDDYGYNIKQFIILDKVFILKRFAKGIIREKKVFKSVSNLYIDINNLVKLRFLKHKTLIVGIAPYDKLMNKYHKIFKKNNSIYFTSWQTWDGSNFPRGNIKNKYMYEKLMRESFNGISCVSKLTNESMKLFSENTDVVNHAIRVDEYKKKKYNNMKNYKKYIFLGRFEERKNINLILEWIDKNKDTSFEFDFAGEGFLEDDIKKMAIKDSRVKLLGLINKDQIKKVLREYDYLVLPSKEEPFGIVLIEALAAGVPCIVSNAPGPKEIISNKYNGFVFDKSDREDFYRIMSESLKINDEKYREISYNSLKSAEIYDSKNIVKKWINIIENNVKDL